MQSLNIYGKTVKIIFEKAFEFSYHADILKFLRENSEKYELAKKLFDAYNQRNNNYIYTLYKNIIYSQILKILKKNPYFITGNPFEIHVFITDSRLSEYYQHISSPNYAYFFFNPIYGVRFDHYENDLNRRMMHEFIHHLDNPYIKRYKSVFEKLIFRAEDVKDLSLNSALLIDCLSKLRLEAPTHLYDVNALGGDYSAVIFDFSKFFLFNKCLVEFSSADRERGLNAYNALSKDYAFHHVGSMIAAIILAAHMKKTGHKKDLILAKANLSSKDAYKADISLLPKIFNKENFILGFKINKSIFVHLIKDIIMKLERSGFLKKYEESCHYFGIKDPIITLTKYNQAKIDCYKNFQKLKAANNFKS